MSYLIGINQELISSGNPAMINLCLKYKITYWFDPGAQSHLHVPGGTRGRRICLEILLRVTPLKAGELKVIEGTLGTDSMGLQGGEVGLEKHTTPPKKKGLITTSS